MNQKNNKDDKNNLPIWNKLELKKGKKIKSNLILNGHCTKDASTNHSMIQNNVYRVINNKNKIVKNSSKMTVSSDNIMKNKTKANILFNDNENNYIHTKIMKVQRLNSKKEKNQLVEENKENININNILNKKKENNKLINRFGAKINSLLNHKNTKNKNSKIRYHTPKKKKIIKYYK